MQNNVIACQKTKYFFHGMPREGDRTTGVHACVGTAKGVPRPVETNRPSESHTGCMQKCELVDHNW